MLTVARVASSCQRLLRGKATGVIKAAARRRRLWRIRPACYCAKSRRSGCRRPGLVCIFEGFWAGLTTSPEELEEILAQQREAAAEPVEVAKIQEEVLVNKYCTEFIILGEGIDPEEVRKELETQGDSVIVVGDEHVTKVHIHTDYPGKILQYCGDLGNLTVAVTI